jgi:uncharacterized protein
MSRVPTYLRPGVYVEEVEAGSWASQRGSAYEPSRPLKAGATTWLAEHSVAAFVGRTEQSQRDGPVLVTSWEGYLREFWGWSDTTVHLPRAVNGFFQNGGTKCWIVPTDGDVSDGLRMLEGVDDVSTVCLPDAVSLDEEAMHAAQLTAIAHCEIMGDRVAILDPPPDLDPQQMRDWRTNHGYDSKFAALYYPWLRVVDDNEFVAVPPCGHVAGAYARSDLLRGPQHSAANIVLDGVLWPERNLLLDEQELLHPWGINALMRTAGGLSVWGARTLSSDPAWRYLQRRRLMNFISRNIRVGTSWAIFESRDDDSLLERIERDLSEFLGLLWRSGALGGAETPAEAYFVRCDEAANPPEVRDAHQIVANCGINAGQNSLYFRVVYFLG